MSRSISTEYFLGLNSCITCVEDAWGRSPLWCAVTRGQLAAVRQLLADPEVAVAGLDSYGKDLATR